jgi:hypothetical protein
MKLTHFLKPLSQKETDNCDDLRCDTISCNKAHIDDPRCKGERLIGNHHNGDFRSGSGGGCLQVPHHMVIVDWRVNLRSRRHVTAHQSGAA